MGRTSETMATVRRENATLRERMPGVEGEGVLDAKTRARIGGALVRHRMDAGGYHLCNRLR